jgi:tetratricopeptide (TPR) repeat protein
MEQAGMEQAGWRQGKIRPWRRWGLSCAVGVALTSTLLVMTQLNGQFLGTVRSQIEQLQHRSFSTLKAPYRYPFYGSTNRYPVATIAREIAHYQQQVQAHPQSGLDQAALAAAYLSMARLTGEGSWYLLADQTAQQSWAQLPVENPTAIAVLARVAEARHDFKQALRWVAQIPDSKEAIAIQTTTNLAMGQLPEAHRSATALVDATLSLNAFTLLAIVNVAQGKDAEALQSFHQGLAVEEAGEGLNSARIRTLLGRFYYERGQLRQARDLYQEALAILPDYPLALLNLAQLDIREADYNRAAARYGQILGTSRTTPDNTTPFAPLILRGQARIQQARGDRQAAIALWAEAETQLRQSFQGVLAFGHRRDLARLLLERGRSEDLAEAVTLIQAEVQVRRDADTLDTLAWALFQAGRGQEAQSVMQSAIALGTRSASLFDRAAAIERALGNPAKAQTYQHRAQTLDPHFGAGARTAAGLSAGLGS